jgi:hypothetical protein
MATLIAPNTVRDRLRHEAELAWQDLNEILKAVPGETIEDAVAQFGPVDEEQSWISAEASWTGRYYVQTTAFDPSFMVDSILLNEYAFSQPGYLQALVKAIVSIPDGLAAMLVGIRDIFEYGGEGSIDRLAQVKDCLKEIVNAEESWRQLAT